MSYQIVIGSWIQATGAVINAIDQRDSIVLAKMGNVLQAMGNALISDYTEEELSKLSNRIQSIGNLYVVNGLYRRNVQYEIQGNLIQALGGGLGILVAIKENDKVDFQGHLLQVIGNSTQAVAGMKEKLKKINASLMDYAGAWIQAIGSIISAIYATTKLQEAKALYSGKY